MIEDLFSRLSGESIVRRTISFYNKESHFSTGESAVDIFQMFAMDQLNMNYLFSACFINYEIVLTH